MINKVIFVSTCERPNPCPASADDQACDPVAVQREGHVALAVEAIARHGDPGMVDAIALRDADDAKIGLHADIVRSVPPRDSVAPMEIATPVAQESVVSECAEKGLAIAGVGGFDKARIGSGVMVMG